MAALDIVASVAGERATTVLAQDVDHILRHESAEISSPKRYKAQVEKPIDPSVTDTLTSWLDELAAPQRENGDAGNTGGLQ